MNKFIITIVFLLLFTNGGEATKIDPPMPIAETESYEILQRYEIKTSPNKTRIGANIVYIAGGDGSKSKTASKITINGIEVKKGVLPNERNDFLFCADMKEPTNPAVLDSPTSAKQQSQTDDEIPQPKSGAHDYHLVLDKFETNFTIAITNEEGETETFQIKIEPLRLETRDIKLTRGKDAIVRLAGKLVRDKRDGKRSGELSFYLSQKNSGSINETVIQYDEAENLFRLPADALKKFRRGEALLTFYSSALEFIKANENTKVSVNYRHTSESCVQIAD